MTPAEEQAGGIPGDRAMPAVAGVRSVSSRLSSILAVGLMSVLGIGMLVWYYASMMSRQSAAQAAAQETARHRAQGDAPLPPLGALAQPVADSARHAPAGDVSTEPVAHDLTPGQGAIAPAPMTSAFIPAGPLMAAGDPPTAMGGAPPVKGPAQVALERQLGATPFAAQSIANQGAGSPAALSTFPGRLQGSSEASSSSVRDAGALGTLLRPTVTAAVQAEVLPSMRLLLPKGAFIDCTLETAIDSTLPGMTTCITATDTFGADGKVVLLERGTKLVGETRGQVQLGAARIFVLWNEARTPTGVVVPLASPGADELGRAGLSGEVNHHFFERFGAAMLISVLDGAVQATVQSSARAGGVIVSPGGSEGVATEALKGTVAIPPSVTKAQGDRIQIMVARDLDFRSVYALRGDGMVP